MSLVSEGEGLEKALLGREGIEWWWRAWMVRAMLRLLWNMGEK